jgi:hypothetical protein
MQGTVSFGNEKGINMADHEHIVAGEPKHADHHVSEHAGHHHAPVEASAFNAAEIAGFQADDYAAGKAVVLLMLGIFSTGVVLYSIVAYNVMA